MSVADRKEREKQQRRNDIIDAAEKQFFKDFDGVSMDDIARELELSKPTIYLYFKDKESLYFAVALRGIRLMNKIYREALEKSETSYEKLEAMGYASFEFSQKYPDHNRIYRYAMSGRFDASGNEELKEIQKLNEGIGATMCDAIKAGMDEGIVRSDMDPLEIVFYLINTSSGVFNMSAQTKMALNSRGISYSQFVRDFMDCTARAIYNDPKEYERLKKGDEYSKRIAEQYKKSSEI